MATRTTGRRRQLALTNVLYDAVPVTKGRFVEVRDSGGNPSAVPACRG